ncbi:MAG TPA: phosphate ABC transporter substrate-binding protein PstS [Candidatus Angelobacter sp.]|nr:phosphate ABC transporter substrate-binding protein PstS [Candidatus Angelobacter sp.]
MPNIRPFVSRRVFLFSLAGVTLALTGLLGSQLLIAMDSVVIVGSGSSVPVPLFRKWAESYNKRSPAIQFQYLPLGTVEGIKQISHGSGDFGAGEMPLTAKERAEGNLMELPVVLIAIVPIYHVPGVTQELRFSGELLAEIYMGQVKIWNSPQIAKLNPNVPLPNYPISVIYRPAGKGTNYVFTDFLSKTSPKFREEIGVTPSPKWPVGMAAERSSDMAEKVASTQGAIGYVELQYAVQQRLAYGLVLNSAGKFVKGSSETVAEACRGVEAPKWDKLSASLTNAPGANAFPITSFSWVYVRTTPDPARKAALNDFLNWVFDKGQQLGVQEGYSELPDQLLQKTKAKVDSLR